MWHSAEMFPRIRNYAHSDGKTRTGGNFRLSHAAPRQIRTAHVITQPQKLHSQLVGLLTAVMSQETGLTSFPLLHWSLTHLIPWPSNLYGVFRDHQTPRM
jgi:hypothetical protein